jgi:hypothetical protein
MKLPTQPPSHRSHSKLATGWGD